MFGFIADILTSITSILFPVFASYKALRTSDPANLAPWLMYWTTLSLVFMIESQLYFILYWIPFYSWIRLFIHLYLVLPGQQGSVYIYREYIHPFLAEHERQIDRMISDGHAKAKAAGLDVVKQGIEYVRVNILGMPPRQPTPPPSRNVSYSTYLMDCFTMPSAREGLATAGTSDLFALLGKAIGQATYPDSKTRDAKVGDLAASETLVPPSLSGIDRADFINTQRDRLRTLLQAFDVEARHDGDRDRGVGDYDYDDSSSSLRHRPRDSRHSSNPRSWRDAGSSTHRSESEYEDLAYEATPMPDPDQFLPSKSGGAKGEARKSGGGWGNWVWGSYGEKDSALDPRKND